MNNLLPKYFVDFYEVYVSNKYAVTSVYIFRSVSSFTIIITIYLSRYCTANEILKRFDSIFILVRKIVIV